MNRWVLAFLGGLTTAALLSVCSCDDDGSSTGPLNPFSDTTYFRDYAYVENRVFDLGYEGDFEPLDSIRAIYVFTQPRRDSLFHPAALMFTDPNSGSTDYDSMRVVLIPAEQYEVGQIADRNLDFIMFDSSHRDAIGVYMEIDRYNESGFVRRDTIGSVDLRVYRLKYIRAMTVDFHMHHPTWQLMWRNCYRIPRGISVNALTVKIRKGLPGQEQNDSSVSCQMIDSTVQTPYLQILGLDQYNYRDQRIADGRKARSTSSKSPHVSSNYATDQTSGASYFLTQRA